MRNPLIPIILVILSIATYFAFAVPWWTEVTGLKAGIEVADKSITQGKELKELIQNIAEKVDAVPADDRSRLQAVLPVQIDEILFLNDINLLTESHGLQTAGLVLGGDAAGNKKGGSSSTEEASGTASGSAQQKTKEVGFSVSAKYPAFILFLRDLEQSLVLYEIKSIAFSRGGTSDEGSTSAKSTAGTSGKNGQATDGDTYTIKFTTYSVE